MSLNRHHHRALKVLLAAVSLDIALGIAFGISSGTGILTGIYFATATATTVGYGDITPHGWLPHVLAMVIMCTVIPLFASVFSLVTTGLTADHVDRRHEELKRGTGLRGPGRGDNFLMRLIVELDDAAPPGRLKLVLAALAMHRPYVRGAVLAAGQDSGDDAVSAVLAADQGDGEDDTAVAGGGLGTEWW